MRLRFIKVGVPVGALMLLAALMFFAAQGGTFQMLDTRGSIASQQRDLLIFAVTIMSLVAIPVFLLLGWFAIRYRSGNKKAVYRPNWDHSKWLETVWWGIPIVLILILSFVTWRSTHALDPYKPLASTVKPVEIQVVALQWRWLFLYPEEGVASINEFAMPINTPVNFTITSDAPMNSFWIPQLGGQIYAMSGMSTKLHLDADKLGSYRGVSANISGKGHSSMTFNARAVSQSDYAKWLDDIKNVENHEHLDQTSYELVRKPTTKRDVRYYHLHDDTLYDSVIARYMGSHGGGHGGGH